MDLLFSFFKTKVLINVYLFKIKKTTNNHNFNNDLRGEISNDYIHSTSSISNLYNTSLFIRIDRFSFFVIFIFHFIRLDDIFQRF